MGRRNPFSVTIMLGTSIASKVRGALGRFPGANQGNIAVIFAIALVPIISFAGAAIDYPDARSVSINATYTASTTIGSTILVNGSGAVTTDFMRVAGFPNINFSTSSTSAWGNVRMRVAMALDNTGSMRDDGKMPAMKQAAKALIDQLSPLARSPGDIYISIVPFAKDVNMGSSYKNQSWIDWTDWEAANGDWRCNGWNNWGNCTGWTWRPDNHDQWTGCFTDRDQNYDTMNTTPTAATPSTLFPAEQYSYCNSNSSDYLQPIMPLSYNWTSLKSRIDAMEPTGNTNQGIGLAWAWMTLGTGAPFNAPAKDANYVYKDAVILLSDGLNTQNRWYNTA